MTTFSTSIRGVYAKLFACAVFVSLYYVFLVDTALEEATPASLFDPSIGTLRSRRLTSIQNRILEHENDDEEALYDPDWECPIQDCDEVPLCYDPELNIGPVNASCCDDEYRVYAPYFPLNYTRDFSYEYLQEDDLGVVITEGNDTDFQARQFIGNKPTCNSVNVLGDSGNSSFFYHFMKELEGHIGHRQLTCDYSSWELGYVNNETVCRHQANLILENHAGEEYEVHLTTAYYEDGEWVPGWDQGWCSHEAAEAGVCDHNQPAGLDREVSSGLKPDGSLEMDFSQGLGAEFGARQMPPSPVSRKGEDGKWKNQVSVVEDPWHPEEGNVARLDAFVENKGNATHPQWEHAMSGHLTSTRLFAFGRYEVRARIPHMAGYVFGFWAGYSGAPVFSDVRDPRECTVWSDSLEAGDLKSCRYCLDPLPTSASPFWLPKDTSPGKFTPTTLAEFLHTEVDMLFPASHDYLPPYAKVCDSDRDRDRDRDRDGDRDGDRDRDRGGDQDDEEDEGEDEGEDDYSEDDGGDGVDEIERMLAAKDDIDDDDEGINDSDKSYGSRNETEPERKRRCSCANKDNSVGMGTYRWINPLHEGSHADMYSIGSKKFIGDGEYHNYAFEWHTGGSDENPHVDFYIDGVYVGSNTFFVPMAAGRFEIGLFPANDENWNGNIGCNNRTMGDEYTNVFGEKLDSAANYAHYASIYVSEAHFWPYYEEYDLVMPSAFDQPNLNRRAACAIGDGMPCGINPIVPYRTTNYFPEDEEGDYVTPCCGAVCMSYMASLNISACSLGELDPTSDEDGNCPIGEDTVPVYGSRAGAACRCITGPPDMYGDPTFSDEEYDVTCEWHVDRQPDFQPTECIKRDYPMDLDGFQDRDAWDVNLGCRYDIDKVCVDPNLSEEKQLQSCFDWLHENCGQVLGETYFEAFVDRPAYRCRLFIRPPYQQTETNYTNYPGLLPEEVDGVMLPEDEYFQGCKFNFIAHPPAYLPDEVYNGDRSASTDDDDDKPVSGCEWALDYCPGAEISMFNVVVSGVKDINGNHVCEMQRKREYAPRDPEPLEYSGSRTTCDVDYQVFPPFCTATQNCTDWAEEHCDKPHNLTAVCHYNLCRYNTSSKALEETPAVPVCYEEDPAQDDVGREGCSWNYALYPPCGESHEDCMAFIGDHCDTVVDEFYVELAKEADRNGNTRCIIYRKSLFWAGSPTQSCEFASCLDTCANATCPGNDTDTGDDDEDDGLLMLFVQLEMEVERRVNLTAFLSWFTKWLPELTGEFENFESYQFQSALDDEDGNRTAIMARVNITFEDVESRQRAEERFESRRDDLMESLRASFTSHFGLASDAIHEFEFEAYAQAERAASSQAQHEGDDGFAWEDGTTVGVIIGAAVGGLFAVAMTVLGIAMARRRRTARPAVTQSAPATSDTATAGSMGSNPENEDDPEGYPTASHLIRDWQ